MSTASLSPSANRIAWICQIIAAIIMGQTLFFKFAGAPEPVYIFTTLGVEPWGRLAAAGSELVACVLLLIPGTVHLGALFTLGIMGGAIMAHLTKLGVVVLDDGGLLFGMGVATSVAALMVLWLRKQAVLDMIPFFIAGKSR